MGENREIFWCEGRMIGRAWTFHNPCFSTVFDRAQNASMHRLHEARRSGQIKCFILPYLGQLDRELPNPPANLVRAKSRAPAPATAASAAQFVARLMNDAA